MRHVSLALTGLCLSAAAISPDLARAVATGDQNSSYVVAQNAHGQTNPNRKKKNKSGVHGSVGTNGASVGYRTGNGTSVRVGPSGPSVSTRTDSGVRVSVGSNGRFRIGF